MDRLPSAARIAAILLIVIGCRHAPVSRDRLVVAYGSPPATLFPNRANEEVSLSILDNVYDSPFRFDEALGLHPLLVESWSTPDELTWDFQLRSGVRFHDGHPLDSSDLERSLEESLSSPSSDLPRSEITALKTPDSRTLIVHTRRYVPILPVYLQGLLVFGGSQVPTALPPGTGPYRIKSLTPSGEQTVLEAVPGNWRGAPSVHEIVFRTIPDPMERLRLLERRKVNLIIDPPAASVRDLESSKSVRVIARPGLRVILLGFNCRPGPNRHVSPGENPFADRRARNAVAQAIDRSQLVRGPLQGFAHIIDQVVTPEIAGYDQALSSTPFDLAGARRLLDEMGLSRPIHVDLDFPLHKYRNLTEVVPAIAKDLLRLGIVVRPRPAPVSDFLDRLRRHDTALYLLGWLTSTEAGVSYQDLFHTSEGQAGADNFGGYTNPEVDRQLDEAGSLWEADMRYTRYRSVAAIVQQDNPVLPLYREDDLYAFDRDLDFRPRADRRIVGRDIQWRPAPPD